MKELTHAVLMQATFKTTNFSDMTRLVGILIFSICFMCQINAQFGYGISAKTGLYERWSNPEDDISSRSAGSALINLGVGPKIWLGSSKFSISAEATANLAPFAFSLSEFKGLGAASFPVIARLNFGGLSGLNKKGTIGISIGGGWQWAKTEVFGLTPKFENQGGVRDFYKSFIGEVAAGFGMSGFTGYLYLRYGKNNELGVKTFNLGIGYDFNVPTLKVFTDPEF